MRELSALFDCVAIGCGIYAMNKVLEHLGEKKAIKEIENMMN